MQIFIIYFLEMSNCSISKYCTETVHKLDECLLRRNIYYGIKYQLDKFALLCKQCESLTWGVESIPTFYMIHGGHLGRLSKHRKEKLAGKIIQKMERKRRSPVVQNGGNLTHTPSSGHVAERSEGSRHSHAACPSSGPRQSLFSRLRRCPESASVQTSGSVAGPSSGPVLERFIAGPSSGSVSRKRAAVPVVVHPKRDRCSKQTVKKALGGSHVIVRTDVSGDMSSRITVPQCLIDQMVTQMQRMGTVKIQFGVDA